MSVSSNIIADFHNAEDASFVNNRMVDYTGRPAKRAESGYWRSACYIIGVGTVERFAFFGIASNLITYLTGPLGQPTAAAAASINIWSGTGLLLPLFGAFVADSFLGRYRTVVISSLLYILALGLLTTSALLNQQVMSEIHPRFPDHLEVLFFYISLYLIAVGQGMHKPCLLAFGADQFDDQDPVELTCRSSFFNWWACCICAGPLAALMVLNYIQDNISWGLGFGIPCLAMAISLVVFLLGAKSYRYNVKVGEKCAISRVSYVFYKAAMNWRAIPSPGTYVEEEHGTIPRLCSQKFTFLNKALLAPEGFVEYNELCSIHEVEEAKTLLNLIPLWATLLPFAIVLQQPATLFTEQAITTDRSITSTFNIPAASLQYIIGVTILILIPIYDRIFVPLAKIVTGTPCGITKLQRIGTGMILCTLSMVTAALVEKKRLQTSAIYGMSDPASHTNATMSFWWLIPQYVLYGVSEIFTLIGSQELFYDQMPCDLKSVGLSLFLSVLGVGSFFSSFIICMIERLSSGNGEGGWFSDNMSEGHLDYFYWLLAGINAVGFIGFLCIARGFSCKTGNIV